MDYQSVTAFAAELDARRSRVVYLFTCYNDRRFDEMLANYAEDIAFTSPSLQPDESPAEASGIGKAAIQTRLGLFHDRYGQLTVQDVFAAGDQVSVIVKNDEGRCFSFSIETSPGQLVQRLLVFPTT